jgi:putative SOS response-associated peptidase YedK
MCGRYTLKNPDPAKLRARFDLDPFAELDERPRFNIAPTDPVLAIRATESGKREPGTRRSTSSRRSGTRSGFAAA